jgi:hypothetical protein
MFDKARTVRVLVKHCIGHDWIVKETLNKPPGKIPATRFEAYL